MPVLSWINSNLTTNPNHMSKVSAQNGNWNKARLRWVGFDFDFSFLVAPRGGTTTPPLGWSLVTGQSGLNLTLPRDTEAKNG